MKTKAQRKAYISSQAGGGSAAAVQPVMVDPLPIMLRAVGGQMPSMIARIVGAFAPGTEVGDEIVSIVDGFLGAPDRKQCLGTLSIFRSAHHLGLDPTLFEDQTQNRCCCDLVC